MDILSKANANPVLCQILLDFDGIIIPSLENFYNSVEISANWVETYFGKSTAEYVEDSFLKDGSTAFRQKLTLRLPNMTEDLAIRTKLFHRVKNIKVVFSNSMELVIGRNDISQNRKPRVSTKNDGKFITVEFYSESIMPSGICISDVIYEGFPKVIPVNLS